MEYEFSGCLPIAFGGVTVELATETVIQIDCNFTDVVANLRRNVMNWLHDTLTSPQGGRPVLIDVFDRDLQPTQLYEFGDSVITGYRFPVFDLGAVGQPAADAIRFQSLTRTDQ